MKVLVAGVRGQVGRAVVRSAPAAASLVELAHADLDITDAASVDRCLRASKPDVVVNAAAYTAVDRAEQEPDVARLVNETGAANLARAAKKIDARLVHLSTDFVFDGASSKPYLPDDLPHPLSVYGATKLAGETAVKEVLGSSALVLRTAWIYDAQGRNFLRTMLRLMRERGSVRVVVDQVGTPTAAHSLAAAIWAIIARPELAGTFHWTDSGVASWYDFAVAIAEEAAAAARLPAPATVTPIRTSDYPLPAMRPNYSVLDKAATCAALSLTPPHWRQNLRQVIGEIPVA